MADDPLPSPPTTVARTLSIINRLQETQNITFDESMQVYHYLMNGNPQSITLINATQYLYTLRRSLPISRNLPQNKPSRGQGLGRRSYVF